MEDFKEAEKTGATINAEKKVRIKIAVDPFNPGDMVVPVTINGYHWNIKRGESIEVPETVAKILFDAHYI